MDNKVSEAFLEKDNMMFIDLFEKSSDPIVLLYENTIFNVNKSAVRFLGYKNKTDIIGLSLIDISPEFQIDGCSSVEKLQQILESIDKKELHRFDWLYIKADSSLLSVEVSVSIIDINGEKIFHSSWRDMSEYKENTNKLQDHMAELALHNKVLKMVNINTHSLESVLAYFVQGIETLHPEIYCSVLLMNTKLQKLYIGAAPRMPQFYHEAIAAGESLGACSASALIKKNIVVNDIQQSDYWQGFYRQAEAANLEASWSQVILDEDDVIGTFSFYYDRSAMPEDSRLVLSMLERYTNLAKIIIESAYRELELRIAATAFEMQESIIIVDADKTIVRVNHAFEDVTGYYNDDVIGKSLSIFKLPDYGEHFYQELWQELVDTDSWSGELALGKNITAEIFPIWIVMTAVRNRNVVTHYVVSFEDITERKASNEKIKRLAFYDTLTGLPNRRYLMENIEQGIARASRNNTLLGVLMIDLDRFKAVNDTLGHAAGDELLKQVAKRLENQIRESDMVARLGGDEFVILLEKIRSKEDAARVSEKIVKDLSVAFRIMDHESVLIGSSIGISLYPEHGKEVNALMDHADIALYEAKDNGRGCFAYFSEKLTEAALHKLKMETRLRYAIEHGELRVYYQAQVDIKSDEIRSAEALVRWQDPRDGLIPPDYFISIAEECGLIIPLGEWVLRETCRQGKEWLDLGYVPIILAVNVSSKQFTQANVVQTVREVLEDTQFPAKYLELEVTESGLMENQEKTITIFNELHEMGVHLAMDDFGTGYSSLAYLKRFPLDVLKIDKQFIDEVTSDQSDMAITATIIAMGRILGFKVLAEGVETAEQLIFLKENGCDAYQGYLRSKPLDAESFIKLLVNT